MKRRTSAPLITALLWIPSVTLTAQTTGRIVGEVSDSAGQSAPGAAVTLKSPSLQGIRRAVSDERGAFRFPFLPPGSYDVQAANRGFKTTEIIGVRVELDRTASLRIRLEVARDESVDVLGAPPQIDVTSIGIGLNATAELYDRIPLDRSFLAIARVAPGTQQDEVGTAFYGATGAENQYVIDGLNVTGTKRGESESELNFDFVQEVEVKSGGLPAEYGRITGGLLNVITKSGGNDLHGSAFGFFAGGGLQSDDRTASRRPATTTTVDDVASKYDFGAELGGRIVRDRLWFFGAFNRVAENSDTTVIRDLESPGAPAAGSVVSGQRRDNRFAAKLTWQPAASSTLALSIFGDPGRFNGPVDAINGPASTYEGTEQEGGTNAALRYEGAFGGTFLVRGLFGHHSTKSSFAGPGTDTPRIDDLTVIPGASSGGIGVYLDTVSRRNVCKVDVSKFWKGHELRVGGDLEAVAGRADVFVSGGDNVTKLAEDDVVFYSHFFFVDDRALGFDRDDPSTWRPIQPQSSAPHTRNLSLYAQDEWRIRKDLVLNLGVRFERQELKDRFGATALTFGNWAPRLGAVWDVTGNGRSKLYGGASRYFESIPQIIQFRAFRGRVAVQSYNFASTPGSFVPDPQAPAPSEVFGGGAIDVSPGLRGQYVDEWLVGFEHDLRGNFVVGAKGLWRRLGSVIEDVTAGNGDYFLGNPGEGKASSIGFLDGSSAPSPRARRNNYSVELTARRRLSRGWQLLASYLWTRLEGNYDGTYQRSTGQFNPNLNSAFDVGDFLVNGTGRLTSESVHQWKLDGSYELSGRAAGLNLGLSTYWFSGLPLNAYGISFFYDTPLYYLAPRGSMGRGPARFEIDAHASYPIRLSKRVRVKVQADVFNLLDRQAVVRYDEAFNRVQDGPCSGIPEDLCNGDEGLKAKPGTLEPLASLGDPRLVATNPDYLKAGAAFTGSRSLRVGVRVSF